MFSVAQGKILILSYCLPCLDNHVYQDHHHQHEEHHEVLAQPEHEQHNLSIIVDHHDNQQAEHTV